MITFEESATGNNRTDELVNEIAGKGKEKQLLTIDVGCGHRAKGDVNIDLFIRPTGHRCDDQKENTDVPLNTRKVKNLINAECTHLPIRDNIFDVTISNSLIEHIDEPLVLIQEMKRITKNDGKIKIICPHKLSHRREWIFHKHSFNVTWFQRAFALLCIETKQVNVAWRYLPHKFLPWIRLPSHFQIIGTIKKNA